MKVSGQLHAPSALRSEMDSPLFKDRRKVRHGASVEALEKPQLGIELRISARPSLSKFPYWLLTVPLRDLEFQYVLIPIHKQVIRVVYVLRSIAYLCE